MYDSLGMMGESVVCDAVVMHSYFLFEILTAVDFEKCAVRRFVVVLQALVELGTAMLSVRMRLRKM